MTSFDDLHRIKIPPPIHDVSYLSNISTALVVLDIVDHRATGLPGDEVLWRKIKRGFSYELPRGTVVILHDVHGDSKRRVTNIMIVNERLRRYCRLRGKAWFDKESLVKLERLFRVGRVAGIEVKKFKSTKIRRQHG